MSPTVIHLEYPFDDVRAGAGVLSAALSLFSPEDPVEFLLSPRVGLPTVEAVGAFRRLRAELTLPYGEPPQMRIVDAATAAATPVAVRVAASGDPAKDAHAILLLGSVGRQFGSAYGVGGAPWLRGDADLVRADLDLAFRRRQRRPRREHGGRIRVVVLIQRIQVWGAVDPIVAAGLEHPEVELDVVLLSEESSTYQQHAYADVEAFVAERGAKLRDETWLRTQLGEIDVVVTPDPYINRWNTTTGISPMELAESGIRIVLTPYAQALSGQPTNLAMLHNLPFHNMAWRIFAPSRGAVANYARCCTAGTGHIRYVGSAKRERLLSDEASAGHAQALRRRLGTRSVVLWNPHFVGDGELSTFDAMADPILGYVKEHRGLGLIVRPHPRLFTEYQRAGYGETVTAFRKLCDQMPNVLLDESMDAAPAMLAADAMLSDLSSLIAEYHVLGRPIGLLRPDGDIALNEDRECLEDATMIDGPRDVARFLDRLRAAQVRADVTQDDLGTGVRIVETIVAEFTEERSAATAD